MLTVHKGCIQGPPLSFHTFCCCCSLPVLSNQAQRAVHHCQGRRRGRVQVSPFSICFWFSAWVDPSLCSCSILRHALDKVAEIKSLLEERRIGRFAPHCSSSVSVLMFSWLSSLPAAKMAGVYSDNDPPRKTMRRGVLMTLLQQSAMTLPLWIGKPGER